MTTFRSTSAQRSPLPWGGWRVGDLAEATARAWAVTMREGPIVGVLSSEKPAADRRRDGRPAAQHSVREPRHGKEAKRRKACA